MKLMGKRNYAYVCLIFLFILSCLYIFDLIVCNEHWSYTPFQFLNIWVDCITFSRFALQK